MHTMHEKDNFVYADPDQRALRFMIHTYIQQLSTYHYSLASSPASLQVAQYNKWRDASNFIANTLLNEAYAGGYNIVHGTTSTSPHVEKIYQKLKKKGYKIVLLLCLASDETRLEAIKHRETKQGFSQNNPEDTVNKGKMFFERIPVYAKYADEIHFYRSAEGRFSNTEGAPKKSKAFAHFDRESGLTVFDTALMDNFRSEYKHAAGHGTALPDPDPIVRQSRLPGEALHGCFRFL